MEEYFLQSTRDGSDRSAEIEEKLKLYGAWSRNQILYKQQRIFYT